MTESIALLAWYVYLTTPATATIRAGAAEGAIDMGRVLYGDRLVGVEREAFASYRPMVATVAPEWILAATEPEARRQARRRYGLRFVRVQSAASYDATRGDLGWVDRLPSPIGGSR